VSEYQYYEFRTVDRPLDRAAQAALRRISSRARITATSFTNHYEWGDLKGNPREFMERWFDLHLYVANWGTRRLMMRLPERLLNRAEVDPFLRGVDCAEIWSAGDNLIVDICREEVAFDDDWDDGSGWLAELAPLRASLLAGDLRPFYLLWLTAVQDELVCDDELEPLAGIGPLTRALEVFAEFFGIDPDLVQAAAEQASSDEPASEEDVREAVAAIPEREKVELLLRVASGDALVAAELAKRLQKKTGRCLTRRTAGSLRQRVREIEEAHGRAEAERREAERRREAEAAENARRLRLEALKQRGEKVWREVEEEIGRRNSSGYHRAANLLSDLEALAVEEGNQGDFARRLASIRARHEKKGRFIERLAALDAARAMGASGLLRR